MGELEEAEYRKDRLLLDILLTSKTTPSWEPELSKLRADLETLAEAKKKTCELRELVEERDVAIASITKVRAAKSYECRLCKCVTLSSSRGRV